MNTSNCPAGLFTDEIYNWSPQSGQCDQSISAWISIAAIVLFVRFSIFLNIIKVWKTARSRQKERRNASMGKRFRFPIIPALHFLSFISLLIFFILTSLNLINAPSGISHVLLMAWSTPFNLIEFLALRKIVSLGRKIIPWQGNLNESNLTTFDRLLKLINFLMVLLFSLSWLFAIIGCFVETILFDRISLSCLLAEQFLFFFALVYQYQRCLNCLSESEKTNLQMNRNRLADFSQAKRRMVFQQFVMIITACCTCATVLYYAITLAAYWWVLTISFFVELFAYGAVSYSLNSSRKYSSGGAQLNQQQLISSNQIQHDNTTTS